jgi:hypothetical protein
MDDGHQDLALRGLPRPDEQPRALPRLRARPVRDLLGRPPAAVRAGDRGRAAVSVLEGWTRADVRKRQQCARCPNWPEWGWWRDGAVICNACHGDPPDALTRYDARLPVEVRTSAGEDCS